MIFSSPFRLCPHPFHNSTFRCDSRNHSRKNGKIQKRGREADVQPSRPSLSLLAKLAPSLLPCFSLCCPLALSSCPIFIPGRESRGPSHTHSLCELSSSLTAGGRAFWRRLGGLKGDLEGDLQGDLLRLHPLFLFQLMLAPHALTASLTFFPT